MQATGAAFFCAVAQVELSLYVCVCVSTSELSAERWNHIACLVYCLAAACTRSQLVVFECSHGLFNIEAAFPRVCNIRLCIFSQHVPVFGPEVCGWVHW